MKISIRCTTIVKICVVLMLIVHARYFYLVEGSFNRTLLMAYFAIASVLFSWPYIRSFKEIKVILEFIAVWGVTLIATIVSYNNTISDIYPEAIECLSILAAISVYVISKRENSILWIENVIILIGTIIATILVIQGLVLSPRGILIFKLQYSIRLGGIRYVNSTEPILFAAIFAMTRLLENKKEKTRVIKYGYILVISTIELVFVAKTRTLIIMYFVSLIVMVWNAKNSSSKMEFIRKTLFVVLICIGIVWALNTNIAKAYFDEYSTSINTQYDTVSIRHDESNYAISLLKKNPIITLAGTGFISDRNTELNYAGSTLKGIRTDIGLLGFVNEFGILGFIWFIVLFMNVTKSLLKWKGKQRDRVNFIGLYSILVMGIPTLFLFNGERLIYFPIWLGIMMFYNYKNSAEKIE